VGVRSDDPISLAIKNPLKILRRDRDAGSVLQG